MQIKISSALGIVVQTKYTRIIRSTSMSIKYRSFNETQTNWPMIAVDPNDRSKCCEFTALFQHVNEDKQRFLASYNNFQLPRINGGPYILHCRIGALANARLFVRTVFLGRAEIYHP